MQDRLLLLSAGAANTDYLTEKKMLMHAVSTLKMENACLVDALGARSNEFEALRCSGIGSCIATLGWPCIAFNDRPLPATVVIG
jgi:hypothetical protein